MWVQIYDVPKGLISENILKSVRESMGKYIKFDPVNFDGMWRNYARIRVALNVEKPLKRRMKLKRDGNNWNWINFKYEWFSSFCLCVEFLDTIRENAVWFMQIQTRL